MDNEWLARYRAHNDALARRLTMEKPGDRSGAYVPAQLRVSEDLTEKEIAELATDVQMAKLFVSRIHRIAARVVDNALRTELYELADDVEAHLTQDGLLK